ncbi:MAG: hypothetical protein EON93_12760 [Burkholderiales bacterium]|nr:MAG: hypothetical protein EON93_12760 [Burkholderiales bacterium]
MTVTPAEPINALDPATLAEIARVRESGVLGSSGRLVELFDFLASRSADSRPPKEAEIALAVFGKADSEALRDDPVARVYIHRLRKRLDDFYLRHGMPSRVRLDIPKGDYRIVCATPQEATQATDASDAIDATSDGAAPAPPARKVRWGVIAAAFGAVLIGGNVAAWALLDNKPAASAQLADAGIWTDIANSKRPLLIVVGDYYMFGEYEERVKLKRLVRDFTINSKEDLVHSQRDNPGGFDQYSDVAMQYLPASAAYALADLAPVLREGRKVQVMLASELTPDRLKSDDIIYVGLLSGMGKLRDPVFSQSRFSIGASYDQIIDRKTGKMYTSEAFLAAPSDQMYRDYGFFSTFEGPGGNRIAILSGSRDTAVMGVAEALTQIDRLEKVEKKTGGEKDFEALFEVKGQKHVNLEAQVLASNEIDSPTIWGGAPANVASIPKK